MSAAKRLDEVQKQKIRDLHAAGVLQADIAVRFGVSVGTIFYVIKGTSPI